METVFLVSNWMTFFQSIGHILSLPLSETTTIREGAVDLIQRQSTRWYLIENGAEKMARKKWEGRRPPLLPHFYRTHDVPFFFIGSTYNKPKISFYSV